MYCKNCGQKVSSGASYCENCGCSLDNGANSNNNENNNVINIYNSNNNNNNHARYGVSKIGWGIVACLFLGIIGLIIGFLAYPAGSYERQTFIKGWVGTFIVSIVLSIILYAFVFCGVFMSTY